MLRPSRKWTGRPTVPAFCYAYGWEPGLRERSLTLSQFLPRMWASAWSTCSSGDRPPCLGSSFKEDLPFLVRWKPCKQKICGAPSSSSHPALLPLRSIPFSPFPSWKSSCCTSEMDLDAVQSQSAMTYCKWGSVTSASFLLEGRHFLICCQVASPAQPSGRRQASWLEILALAVTSWMLLSISPGTGPQSWNEKCISAYFQERH